MKKKKGTSALLKAWRILGPLVGIAGTLLVIGVAFIICFRSFFLPFPAVVLSAGLVAFVWIVALFHWLRESPGLVGGISLGCGLLALLLTWPLGYFLVHMGRDRFLQTTGLEAKRTQYASTAKFTKKKADTQLGKVVILQDKNNTGYQFDTMFFEMPDRLRPGSEAEVDTVILIHFHSKVVGQYTNGGDAVQWTATVTCADLKNKTIYNWNDFTGNFPPLKSTIGKEMAAPPTTEVREFVLGVIGR